MELNLSDHISHHKTGGLALSENNQRPLRFNGLIAVSDHISPKFTKFSSLELEVLQTLQLTSLSSEDTPRC